MKRTKTHVLYKSRFVVGVAICLLLLTTSIASAFVQPSTNGQQTVSSQTELSYSWAFLAPNFKSTSADGSLYTIVNMPGCISGDIVAGAPQLPLKMVQLLLPPKTTVSSLTVTGSPVVLSVPVDLTTQPVFPYQKSIPFGSDDPQVFEKNNAIYSSDDLYPAQIHTDYTIGYSHGYSIISFGLSPLQYTPSTGDLLYYPTLDVTISLQTTGDVNEFYRNSASDEAYVQSLVSNPEIAQLYQSLDAPTFEYPGGLCDPAEHYDYVIITTTQNGLDYWDTTSTTPYNWESLMNHHAGDGLSCTLVTKQDILACPDYYNATPLFNDSQARIREFCRDAYQDWETQYILIAGDSDTMPARQMYYNFEGNVDADIYWSNLDNSFNADNDNRWGEESDTGFDLYFELAIGRITCDTPQDVSNWLTKSFYYADSTDGDYLDNAGFFGGDTTWDAQGDDFIDYSAIKGTNDWLGPNPDDPGQFPAWVGFQYGFETWNQVNPGNEYNLSVKITEEPPNPGWSNTGVTGFREAINDDRVTIISGIAHANNQMSLGVYDDDWESLYHNTKPFFIHDCGCHCGDFDDGDGIIESMLFHSDVELAFGCIYNTGYGWGQFESTNSSSAFQAKEFWDYFLDMENNSGAFSNWQIGVAQGWSKDQMAPMINWDFSTGSWRGIIECCLLFGDPAQMLKSPHPSQAPQKPSKPVGQSLGIRNVEYSYTSQTSDPENEQIYYLFDWGDGTTSGWLGPYSSGQTGTGSHIWIELGTYNVRVKARDIWGAGSIWSDSLVVTITDNQPPNIPVVTGPAEGKPGNPYLFNMVTEDPQEDNIYYFVDWGDNTTTDWLGPYITGTEIHATHSWDAKGTYNVKVKAKDNMGAESNWGNVTIVMPMDYRFSLSVFLEHLFERFPHAFPVLQQLLGY